MGLAKRAHAHWDFNGKLDEVSLYGAVNIVARNEDTEAEMIHTLWTVLGESPVKWNDAPERTKEEVVELLRECSTLPTKAQQLRNVLRAVLTVHGCGCPVCEAAHTQLEKK